MCSVLPLIEMKFLTSPVRKALQNCGMIPVLLTLCFYYSWVTYGTQQLTGSAAGTQLAEQLRPQDGPVLLVARDSADDKSFLETLQKELIARGTVIVGQVQGEPRDLRQMLERLAGEGKTLKVIATTADCSQWTLIQNISNRFPSLGSPRILVPKSIRWPTFLTQQNLLNVANQITVVAIISAGMTLVVITGGIDLSVGSLVALSAVITTVLIRDWAGGASAGTLPLWGCAIIGLLISGLVGLFSGVMVAGFKVPPFIATLAMMQVISGLAFIVAKGGSIYEIPDAFTRLGRGTGWLGMPNAVWLMLMLYGTAHLLMTQTTLGRCLYAVGGNPEAARLSGVNVPLVLVFAYSFCGFMAGLGGLVQASQLRSGAPTYGQMYELYGVAAVVVGGTSLTGGEGRILGTLVGALIIAVIQNGMNLTGVESYRQKIVLGFLILAAVLLDLLKHQNWQRLFSRILKP